MRKLARADQVARLRHQRHVQAHEIRLPQQALGADQLQSQLFLDRFRRRPRVVINDAHRKAARPPRHRLADASHAENAQRAVMHVLPHQQIHAPLRPLAGMHELVALDHAPRGGQQQREREIGGRIGEHVRRVRHQDAEARGRRQVDVVVAHRHVGDHLDAFQAGQHFRRELIRELAHHALFAADAPRAAPRRCMPSSDSS